MLVQSFKDYNLDGIVGTMIVYDCENTADKYYDLVLPHLSVQPRICCFNGYMNALFIPHKEQSNAPYSD